MAVVERKSGVEKVVGGADSDQFPAGMRVLAVDDDATCLKVLEGLLLRCRYHVTATKQASTALKMLRENKERFDLVITDVHMPDMDGFKLLELVGLEMDLPVIMLSGEADHQDVMKAITHGACDYLVKPARMAELRNIWQHVIRRRRIESREKSNPHNKEDDERAKIASSEGGHAPPKTEVPDCNRKLNRKRNQDDDDDDDEYDSDNKTHANEKPSTQKKQRVVWSIELHRKFVAAVNQLGINKAVPKKILDLMNVEKLTRENVASHLQKYRIFLKKANALAIRQANVVSTRQGRTLTYHPMGSLEGSRNFHPLAKSRQSPALTSLQSNGPLETMNKHTGFGLRALMSSGTFQPVSTRNSISHHTNDLRRLEGTAMVGSSHGNLLHRVPMSLEHQFLQKPNNCFPAGLSTSVLAIGSSSKTLANMTDNTLWIPEHQQQTHSGMLGTHSFSRIPSLSSDLFKIADTYHMAAPLAHNNTPLCNSLYNTAPIISSIDSNLHEVFSSSLAVAPSSSTVVEGDVQNRAGLRNCNRMIMPGSIDENLKFLRNCVQNCEKEEQALTRSPGIIFTSSTTLPNHVPGYVAESQPLSNGLPSGKMDIMTTGQNYDTLCITQDWRADCQQNFSYTVETGKLHHSFSSNACTLEELVNMPQKSEQDDVAFFDEDCVSDIDTPGTCM